MSILAEKRLDRLDVDSEALQEFLIQNGFRVFTKNFVLILEYMPDMLAKQQMQLPQILLDLA